MGQLLTADLDALRALAIKQRCSADVLRTIDLTAALRGPHWALAGTAVAAEMGRACASTQTAISEIAARIDRLARANDAAAQAYRITDDDYASRIRAVASDPR